MPVIQRLLGVFVAGAVSGPMAASAQEMPPPPPFPTTEFAEGADTASVSDGDLTATVTMERPPGMDYDVPMLAVTVAGDLVLETAGVGSGFDFPTAEARIAEIDPGNGYPEVYFASYSGGAHCCNAVIVATEAAGQWMGVSVGDFDGDGDYLHDLDDDGLAEIATIDNRFLYRFDCYACSAGPLMILTVRDGEVVDVSTEARYLAAHRAWLAHMEDSVDPTRRWTSPGYLAGWLAQKVRIGEGPAAWTAINTNWDFATDTGEEVCVSGAPLEDCPRADRQVLSFPERLKLFLDQSGYRF